MSDENPVVYTLDVHVPGAEEGAKFAINGLGEFENGSSYQITQDEADRFRALNSANVPIVDEETNAILGASVEQGPNLFDYVNGSALFTVTDADGNKTSNEPLPSEEAQELVEGNIPQVLERVGDDPDKAVEALEAEQAKDNPRPTLIDKLESIVDEDSEGSDD